MYKKNLKRMILSVVLAGVLSAFVMVSGCTMDEQKDTVVSGTTAAATPAAEIFHEKKVLGYTWTLKSFYDNETGETVSAGDFGATLVLGEDQKMHGYSGCNSFFGDYMLEGDSFKTGPVGSTMMACTDEKSALTESEFLENLGNSAYAGYENDMLIFYDTEKHQILAFERFVLEGTSWELVSMNTGDAITSVSENTTVTISFDENRITGSGGCNSYFADYKTDSISEMEFGPAGSTEMYCEGEDIMATEDAYLALLGDVVGFGLSGKTLILTDGDEKTLLIYKMMP